MKNLFQLIVLCTFLTSCGPQQWAVDQQIDLEETTPIGIAADKSGYWISDGNNNKLIQYDLEGNIKMSLEDFDRPMHIAINNGSVYIPEYGSDQISIITAGEKSVLSLIDSLDAPAGIDVNGDEMAIADFYSHRVLFKSNGSWISFGKEGKGPHDFYYPTDVQIHGDKIFVADAYNNRVKVYDKEGNLLNIFGHQEGMNATIGLYVSAAQVFVMDQENDRVLIYNHDGELIQSLEEGFDKPIDAVQVGEKIYVINYAGKFIQVLKTA